MSSLRNCIKRITHKERSQPRNRYHLGPIEHHKDYVKRAKHYHKRQDQLSFLRQKVYTRNPDEFYFGMCKSELVEGKYRKDPKLLQEDLKDTLGPDAVKIMKSQDLKYVQMQTNIDCKKIEKMKTSLHFLEYSNHVYDEVYSDKIQKHTIFVENSEEAKDMNLAKYFDTEPEFVGRCFNRPRSQNISKYLKSGYDVKETKVARDNMKQKNKKMNSISKARCKSYKELEARKERLEILRKTESQLIGETIAMRKGRKRKVIQGEDGNSSIYKFRRKRAR